MLVIYRSVERPDIIPHSNHSRETSETSNYGYYSPQRAEAQLDRNYGRDERGYPQDPQILRHGRIRPEHDENYPGRPPNQQPKEPPRLYLTEEQPSATLPNGPSQQPNRENLSLPVSQNNLYVDIPHTYVNIGDTMTQRGDEQVSPAPNRPPLPTAVRSQYVEELAQAKTPKTSRELLDAERALELRMQQPAYFNYPTPTNEAMPQFPVSFDLNLNLFFKMTANTEKYYQFSSFSCLGNCWFFNSPSQRLKLAFLIKICPSLLLLLLS